MIQRFNGSTWDRPPIFYYNGTSWITPKRKRYDGSQWVPVSSEPYDFFLACGQSNAVGYPDSYGQAGFDVPQKSVEGIEIKYNGEIIPSITDPGMGAFYNDGAQQIWVQSNGSIYPAFAERWTQLTGRKCIICMMARGGSPLMAASDTHGRGYWNGAGGLYQKYAKGFLDSILAVLSNAGYDFTFRGMLFWDSERDALALDEGLINQAQFQAELNAFVDQFYLDYSAEYPDVMVYIMQIGIYQSPGSDNIQFQQAYVAENNAHAILAYENNYVNRENQHYYLSQYYNIGTITAETIYGILGG